LEAVIATAAADIVMLQREKEREREDWENKWSVAAYMEQGREKG
jgi:hypothetical protein